MPSPARAKTRPPRRKPVCVCGHIEALHTAGKPHKCRFLVPQVRHLARMTLVRPEPCPCSGYADTTSFINV